MSYGGLYISEEETSTTWINSTNRARVCGKWAYTGESSRVAVATLPVGYADGYRRRLGMMTKVVNHSYSRIVSHPKLHTHILSLIRALSLLNSISSERSLLLCLGWWPSMSHSWASMYGYDHGRCNRRALSGGRWGHTHRQTRWLRSVGRVYLYCICISLL